MSTSLAVGLVVVFAIFALYVLSVLSWLKKSINALGSEIRGISDRLAQLSSATAEARTLEASRRPTQAARERVVAAGVHRRGKCAGWRGFCERSYAPTQPTREVPETQCWSCASCIAVEQECCRTVARRSLLIFGQKDSRKHILLQCRLRAPPPTTGGLRRLLVPGNRRVRPLLVNLKLCPSGPTGSRLLSSAPKHRGLGSARRRTVAHRVGALTLIIGLAFFFKYAVDRGWVTQSMRVAAVLIVGGGLLALVLTQRGVGLPSSLKELWRSGSQRSTSQSCRQNMYHIWPASVAVSAMLVVTALGFEEAMGMIPGPCRCSHL